MTTEDVTNILMGTDVEAKKVLYLSPRFIVDGGFYRASNGLILLGNLLTEDNIIILSQCRDTMDIIKLLLSNKKEKLLVELVESGVISLDEDIIHKLTEIRMGSYIKLLAHYHQEELSNLLLKTYPINKPIIIDNLSIPSLEKLYIKSIEEWNRELFTFLLTYSVRGVTKEVEKLLSKDSMRIWLHQYHKSVHKVTELEEGGDEYTAYCDECGGGLTEEDSRICAKCSKDLELLVAVESNPKDYVLESGILWRVDYDVKGTDSYKTISGVYVKGNDLLFVADTNINTTLRRLMK